MKRDSAGKRRGATLIEFSLVCLVLMALIFGSIEMDRLLLVYTAMANSARAGVRYAAVHGVFNPTSISNVQQVVKNLASTGILDPSRMTIAVSYQDTTKRIGSSVSVSVQYPYDPFTFFFPLGGITLRSTSQGTIAF
jgi:Flp pilus assembly protein TadG